MNDEIPQGDPAPQYPYQEGKAIQKVRYTHDAMIDEIVRNPGVSQNQLAAIFGYTPGWVSLVMSSDAFQERLAERKEELIDPVIRASVEERMKALVVRSLEVLQDKLARPANQIPDGLALKALELGAKGLGIGGNAAPKVDVGEGRLEQLADRLIRLQNRVRGGTYEGQAAQVEDAVFIEVQPQGA